MLGTGILLKDVLVHMGSLVEHEKKLQGEAN